MTVEKKREILREVKTAVERGDHAEAFATLVRTAEPDDPFELQDRYVKLLKKLPTKELGLTPLKLALLGTSTIDHFAQTLRFWLALSGFELELFVSDYGTLEQTVLEPNSELYRFKPEIVWLFTTGRDVLSDAEAETPESADDAVRAAVSRTRSIWSAIAERLPAQVVQNNADLDSVRPFGNFEGAVTWSRTSLLRAYNVELARAARAGVTIFDLDYLAGDLGRRTFHDSRWWYHSKHAIAPESLGVVAHAAAKLIASIKGRAKKCVVLDLDNTLWGGVIGDDGLEGIRLGEGDGTGEAHSAFQRYLKRLERRGIVLAVASKNEDAAARLPFERHPEMVLRLEDIAVFRANWNDKASNIRSIATTLNLGLDSFVFVDDNPVERDLVRRELPMVAVPELGDNPARFRELIDRALFFETTTFSADDRGRASAYRQNAQRADAEASFTDVPGFLQSLSMRGTVGELDEVNLPRFVQLLNKSNQFHLTTTRYTEAQVRTFMKDSERACVWFRLEDRFGDNGLISTVILDLPRAEGGTVTIDTWAMSCRVLSRGMEEFIASEILGYARRFNARIVGRYIPTAKNALVRDLYSRLGFQKVDDREGTTTWEIDPNTGKVDWGHHIERVQAPPNGGSR